jgi:hypothetical protein
MNQDLKNFHELLAFAICFAERLKPFFLPLTVNSPRLKKIRRFRQSAVKRSAITENEV